MKKFIKKAFFQLHHLYDCLFCTFTILNCQKKNKNGVPPVL